MLEWLDMETSEALVHFVLLPGFVFAARVLDVTLGTMRFIAIARGQRGVASMLGFLEVVAWLLAMGQIFRNLDNVACFLAYAGGYSLGTYLGLRLEQSFSKGSVLVRIVSKSDASPLVRALEAEGFPAFHNEVLSDASDGGLVSVLVPRAKLDRLRRTIGLHAQDAHFSVETVRKVSDALPSLGTLPGFFWARRLALKRR